MLSRKGLKDKLRAAEDETRYRLYFAALLSAEAAVAPDDFFVVGGSAIEVYTGGAYTSGDIDIVCAHDDRLRRVLRAWGFGNTGRIWSSDELGLVIDLVRLPYSGSAERTTLMTTPYGPVRLAAVEDLLIKRLSSMKHWRIPGHLDHAKMLASEFADQIDWEYAGRYGREHDVGELVEELRVAVEHGRRRRRR